MTPGAGLLTDECIMDIAPPCEATDTKWFLPGLRQFERVPEIAAVLLEAVGKRYFGLPIQQRLRLGESR
jgi:hypothetical protein